MPIGNMEQYNKAKSLVDSGTAKDPGRLGQSMAAFRGTNPHLFQGSIPSTLGPGASLAQEEGIAGLAEQEVPRFAPKAESHSAPKLDMSDSSVSSYLNTVADDDPKRFELAAEVRRQTEDESLPTASKLKALNAPPEWEPKAVNNPFSSLPAPPKDTQYFYEPSLEEFQEAISTGVMAKQLAREFPGQKMEIDPRFLAESKSFKAYKDAAWKHALADAMKTNTPIVRAEFSKKPSILEGLQAKALDPVVAGASGVLSGMSMGLADPLIRSVAPETAEAERRSRMRNPSADFAGQLVGGLSPTGLPSLVAKGATKALGAIGLGNKGLSGLAKSTAAGVATGAAESNVRAIAQSAADALDAGESAVEAVQRIYDTIVSQSTIDRTGQGGALGGAMGAGGHLVGSVANKGARTLVSEGGNLKRPLANSMDAGVKMSPVGEPVLPPELTTQIARARGKGMDADELLAQEAAGPMAAKRLTEMEAATARGTRETQRMREHFGEATVPTYSAAQDILNLTSEIPGVTGLGRGKVRELNRIARRLRGMEKISPKQLDEIIAEVDDRAAAKEGSNKDPHFMGASAILRNLRDEFASADATTPVGIRDAEGNVKGVSGYGAMKAKQSREQWLQQVDNEHMGLPKDLKAQPVDLPKAPDNDSLQALAEGSEPRPKVAGRQLATFESNIQQYGDRGNRSRDKVLGALGDRAGQTEKLEMIKKLRSSQEWKGMLGKAISGVGSGGGTYLKTAQLLRTVPTLKSLSGGLDNPGAVPKVEASPEAEALIDKFLEQAVPEARVLNLRGGQAARPGGSINHRGDEKKLRDDMTSDEAEFALQVIKNILATEGQKLKKAQ